MNSKSIISQGDAFANEKAHRKGQPKSRPIPVGWAVGPRGKPFPCNMARHIGSLSDFGFYEVLARICNLAEAEKENRKLAPDELPERGTLCASLLTIADAAGVSISTARAKMKRLEKLGLLLDHRKGSRKRGGAGFAPTPILW